jgi:ElaB/YqjD/DUF883 family membrane-anchored ribosome-binding protein
MTNHSHTHSHNGSKEAFSKLESLEHNASAKAEALIHEIAQRSSKLGSDVQEYTDATAQYIRRHPVRSTIIAGVAGLILGKLLSK